MYLHLKENGEACNSQNAVPAVKSGGGSIMQLGSFTKGEVGVLHNIEGITRKCSSKI